MKTVYYLLSTFFAILATTACNQPGNTFRIVGQIDHVVDGDVAQLFTIEGNVGTLFMKDTVRNGKFSFEGNTDSLQMLSFMVYGNNYPMTTALIWIAPGSRTKITGIGYYLSSWNIESNVKEQQEEEIYRNALGVLSSTSDSLLLLYYRSIDRMQQTNSNEMESVRKELRRLRDQMDSVDFIKHRSDFNTCIISLPTNKSKAPKGNSFIAIFSPCSLFGRDNPWANAELYDPQGNPHRIAEDFQGKYLLLDFWGVGCAPCIAAFPEMKEIHEAHKDKLTIISITTDTEKIWKDGLERHHVYSIVANNY